MLIAPPFGLLASGRAGSKDMSAFADQCIIYGFVVVVKKKCGKLLSDGRISKIGRPDWGARSIA